MISFGQPSKKEPYTSYRRACSQIPTQWSCVSLNLSPLWHMLQVRTFHAEKGRNKITGQNTCARGLGLRYILRKSRGIEVFAGGDSLMLASRIVFLVQRTRRGFLSGEGNPLLPDMERKASSPANGIYLGCRD